MAQPKLDFRYDSEAVDYMDEESTRFYNIWLSLATKHASDDNRNKVNKEDAEATFSIALQEFQEPVE